MGKRLNYLGILQKKGVASVAQIKEAQEMSIKTGRTIQDILIHLGYATSDDIARALAEEYNKEYVDLTEVMIRPSVVEQIGESMARENTIMPFDEDGDVLRVVISDPNDFDSINKIRFYVNRPIEVVISTREGINEAINRHYSQVLGQSTDSMMQEMTDTAIDFTSIESDVAASGGGADDESEGPIVRLVSHLISEAVQLRASDIHVEPFEDRVRIRYRIDGMLVERDKIPKRLQLPQNFYQQSGIP